MSMVSVSRRPSPPHCGHEARTNASFRASGDSPVGLNSASSGSSTGNSASGTGTAPHVGQWMIGMGVPQ